MVLISQNGDSDCVFINPILFLISAKQSKSAVFILMVIMHLLIVMYNNMSDNSISFEKQYLTKPMTKQGLQWVNCAFGCLCLKTDLYNYMFFFFFSLHIHSYSMCLTQKGQGTLLFTSSSTSCFEWVKVQQGYRVALVQAEGT